MNKNIKDLVLKKIENNKTRNNLKNLLVNKSKPKANDIPDLGKIKFNPENNEIIIPLFSNYRFD